MLKEVGIDNIINEYQGGSQRGDRDIALCLFIVISIGVGEEILFVAKRVEKRGLVFRFC